MIVSCLYPEVEWVLLEPPLGTALHNRFALVLSEFLVERLHNVSVAVLSEHESNTRVAEATSASAAAMARRTVARCSAAGQLQAVS